MKYWLACLLMLSCLIKVHAYGLTSPMANCQFIGGDFINYAPHLTVSADLPVYSELGSAVILQSKLVCKAPVSTFDFYSVAASNFINQNIIPTTIAGLGVKLSLTGQMYLQAPNGQLAMTDGCDTAVTLSASTNLFSCDYAESSHDYEHSLTTVLSVLVTFVKTNNQLQTSPLQPINLAQGQTFSLTLTSHEGQSEVMPFANGVVQAQITVEEPTCTLVLHNYVIPLPPIHGRRFSC